MKRKWMKLAAVCLSAALLMPLSAPAFAGQPQEQIMRIGLAYGSSALPSANLENSVGFGYRLGYFDQDRQFVELARTNSTAISMLKTQDLYFKNGVSSPTHRDGYRRYGCHHLKLGEYKTLEAARSAIEGVNGGFPAWIDGHYEARVGFYVTEEDAGDARKKLGLPDSEIVWTSDYAVNVVETRSGDAIFQYDGDSGKAPALGVMPDVTGKEAPQTWFKGRKYFGGFRYERLGGGDLTVVNMVELEDYVGCVITWEMSAYWPTEALKAQACCARTYAVKNKGRHEAQHFDVCSEIHCQAYHGTENLRENSIRAAAESEGVYIRYNGALIDAVYSSSNGGASEDSENVWSNTVPYLRGKLDPYETKVASEIPSYHWTRTYTADELTERLRSKGYMCARITDVQITEHTSTGGVKALTFYDAAGKKWTFRKGDARSILGVKSLRFTVSSTGGSGDGFYVDEGDKLDLTQPLYAIGGDGSISQVGKVNNPYVITASGVEQLTPQGGGGDKYIISGTGNGHGVGMSQYGAYAMAQDGYTYDQILRFYYTGVEIG